MLAVLGFMGLTNIHRMNGLKNWGALCINAVAVPVFAAGGIVHWPIALTMAVGGVLGGYARSEEHTSELQSQSNLVCRLLLEKKKKNIHRLVTRDGLNITLVTAHVG